MLKYIVLIGSLAYFFRLNSCRKFGIGHRWFRGGQYLDRDEEQNILFLRGGSTSSDSKGGNGKIEGPCVGIDLGTTYRYCIIPLFKSSFLSKDKDHSVALLFGGMAV